MNPNKTDTGIADTLALLATAKTLFQWRTGGEENMLTTLKDFGRPSPTLSTYFLRPPVRH